MMSFLMYDMRFSVLYLLKLCLVLIIASMAYYYCKVTVFFVSNQIKHRLSHRLLHRLLHRLFTTSHDIFCTNGTNLTILLCTNGTNLTIFLCTNGTNLTIFASERHDSSLHERHELNDFRRRKTRFFFARMSRFSHFDKIVLSACRHRIIRVIRAKESCHRLADIVPFVLKAFLIIVFSACRYRIIRAFRA